MNQIELEKIADSFDRDHDGFIDLSEINAILRGIRRTRSLAKHPVTDSEKIEEEVSRVQRDWKEGGRRSRRKMVSLVDIFVYKLIVVFF